MCCLDLEVIEYRKEEMKEFLKNKGKEELNILKELLKFEYIKYETDMKDIYKYKKNKIISYSILYRGFTYELLINEYGDIIGCLFEGYFASKEVIEGIIDEIIKESNYETYR